MKSFLLFHKTSSLKFRLDRIARPEEHRLHLVTQEHEGVQLPSDGWRHINEKTTLSRWNLDVLQPVVAREIAQFGAEHVQLLSHDEYSLMLVAQLRERFHLPGPKPEQVTRFTNKLRMKEHIAAQGIRIPRYVHVDTHAYARDPAAERARIVDHVGLPAFAKPIDGTCSEGVARLDTLEQLDVWLEAHRGCTNYEIDEYVTGELYHVDCVIVKGAVVHTQVTLDAFPNAETLQGKPFGSLTLPLQTPLSQRLQAFNQTCLNALAPLIDGTTHLELFLTRNNELVFLEVAARSPGAKSPQAYEINSGLNFQELYFTIHMGLPISLTPRSGPYVAWCWYPTRDGVLTAYQQPSVAALYEMTQHIKPGTVCTAARSMRERSCEVFLTHPDFAIVQRDFDVLRFAYEPGVYEPVGSS